MLNIQIKNVLENIIEEDRYIKFNDLEKEDGVLHLFSKKPFNFNRKLLDEENINEEYKEIFKLLKYEPKKIATPHQTHSNNVIVVDETNINDTFEETDGLITNLKGIALITVTADCQAILLYDKNKKLIANIHSGWKGTLNQILKNAVNLMIDKYDSNVKDIKMYICPSIRKCCFEVDKDVRDLFKEKFQIEESKYIFKGEIKDGKEKYFIDTIKLNMLLAEGMGILKENIFESNICTKCKSDKFHSYRKDKDESGRNLALIVLNKD